MIRLGALASISCVLTLAIGCGAGRGDSSTTLTGDSGGGGDSTGDETSDTGPVEFDIGPGDDTGGSDGPIDPDAGCAKATASASKIPVDVIIVIDQSGSMGTESTQVQTNLNSLAKFLGDTKLDYRVVMIAGRTGSLPMCVPAPLSDGACGSKAPKYRSVNQHIESWDALRWIADTYDMTDADHKWSDVLRKDAFKIFIPITDDDAKDSKFYSGAGSVTAAFDAWALSKGSGTACGAGCFGTKTKRKYAMYPIIGVNGPTDTSKCSSAVNNGPEYLGLVTLTKGKAFSVCAADYGPVFKEIGKAIATTVACEIVVPPPPAGETFDPTKVNVLMTQGGTTTPIVQDASVDCAAGANGWQYNADKTKILLCGDACLKAKADPSTVLDVVFGCATHVK